MTYFLNFLKILPCSLTIKVRGLIIFTSKSLSQLLWQIKDRGTPPPQPKKDKKSQARIGLMFFFQPNSNQTKNGLDLILEN